MDLNAIFKAVLAPQELRGPGDALKDLALGDKLTGKVLSVENDGRVLVDLGRSRILAQISFPVKPGQVLDLQVVETGRILHFKAFGGESGTLAAPMPREDFSQVFTKTQLAQFERLLEQMMPSAGAGRHSEVVPADVLDALSQVRTLFETVPVERPMNQITQWIKTAVEDRGILFEKKLADLVTSQLSAPDQDAVLESDSPPAKALITRDIKPQLMILRDFLAQADDQVESALKLPPREADVLRHGVERLLQHVTQQQERAVVRWQGGETQQVFVHLWPFQKQHAPVELKVYYPKRRGGEDDRRQHHIALLLDMDRLGPIRVDLTLIEAQLHISFFVGSEEIKARFQDGIQPVKETLVETFPQLLVDIYVSREKIARFHEDDAKGATAGRVDIKA